MLNIRTVTTLLPFVNKVTTTSTRTCAALRQLHGSPPWRFRSIRSTDDISTKRNICTGNGYTMHGISTTQKEIQHLGTEEKDATLISAKALNGTKVEVVWSAGNTTYYPTTWLRDNCQCPTCFNESALGRWYYLEELQLCPHTKTVDILNATTTDYERMEVQWEDGHRSTYSTKWLKARSFSEDDRQKYRNHFKLPKVLWSTEHKVAKYNYHSLMSDDAELLHWLIDLETSGATLVQDTPAKPTAAQELCQRVAVSMSTHYGDYSTIITHPNPNNLAFTSQKLSLHNDLPQYVDMPGIILLHIIKQHTGVGGDTVISDGVNAAEQLRQKHPHLFHLLTTTDVYFWDIGTAQSEMEMAEFNKLNKGPILELNTSGEVSVIRFNNQVRDSFLDLPEDKVNDFYVALKTYFNFMYLNSITFKMQNGDMSVLDNLRCQHGRQAMQGQETGRHLITTYMAWDEAKCRRRRLQAANNAQT